jgi:hypothetical protein
MHKGDLYIHMRDEFREAGMDPLDIPAPQTFLYIWRTTYLQLKIPRHNTLGVCDTCCSLKESMHSLSRHSKERGNIQGAFMEHLSQVRTEKHAQIKRDQNSTSYPKSSWAITTDFMQDFFQPFKYHRPKSWYVL